MRVAKQLLFGFVFLVVTTSAHSQSDSISTDSIKSKIRYFNQVTVGGLFDKEGEPFLTLSTVHGIRRGNTHVGIGLSYDIYDRWKVIPVTLVVGHDLLKLGDNRLFIQGGGGYSFASYMESADDYLDLDTKNGFTMQAGIGYRIKTDKLNVYILSGYKFQKISYEQSVRLWIWGPPSGPATSIERESQRLFIQVGFGLY